MNSIPHPFALALLIIAVVAALLGFSGLAASPGATRAFASLTTGAH